MNNMKYEFRFPVGDWSGDGHNRCEWFHVQSNKPIEEWRKAYFTSLDNFKERIDIEIVPDIVPDSYNGGKRDNGWPLHLMRSIVGFDFPNTDYDSVTDDSGNVISSNDIPCVGFPNPKDAVGYTLTFCQVSDPSLEFKILEEKESPMFPFNGFDEQKRHIGHIGYEIFMDGW